MGAACHSCSTGPDYSIDVPLRGMADVKVLMVAINYAKCEAAGTLTATTDAARFHRIATAAGISDITVISDCTQTDPLYAYSASNGMPTKDNITRAIEAIGNRLDDEDIFIFFYAGHGVEIPDEDGDEADGNDEAMATLDNENNMNFDTVFVDDDFSNCLLTNIPKSVRTLCFFDCCHSGSILDFDRYADDPKIQARSMVCVSAARDYETAKEVMAAGGGGEATTSMSHAVADLDNRMPAPYTIEDVVKAMREGMAKDGYSQNAKEKGDDMSQHITVTALKGCPIDKFPWPMSPRFGANLQIVDLDSEDGSEE